MYDEGISGTGGNMDGYYGALFSLTHVGHGGHCGGGKPPPPMLNLLRHTGTVDGPERPPPQHIPIIQGSREEAPKDGHIGGSGGNI